ncbi:T9SS type A sorting domain-containing protein [Spirosoma validum]|uniref:T9SS type A sorting domain-containing protein n=1 Tax=Spirosoma validum TaxID=2771355 RepID=A0A927GGS8_9BACT|nr:T9SS type A sorting domain-containing protein [Spirosoma validum]MBD2756925.1 T9SS type A sorting domain-containing protein [Spirosoma validum]
MTNGVYERENKLWNGDYLSYGPEELNYAKNWLQERVTFLDTYFENFAGNQPIIYSFNAAVSGTDVVLNWRANCSAISSFAVEASSDSLNWHTITPISILANDSITCNYSFTDTNVEANTVYYRLKVADKNSGIFYSSVRYVHLDFPVNFSIVSIFPNPVSTTLQIQGNIEKVNILSLQGVSVYEADNGSPTGINVQSFPAGVYVVRVTQKDGLISSHRIVINR